MLFTLKQLHYFVAAGRSGSVTKAAAEVSVSQPSISAAIAHLEEVLALQLFVRHHAQGLSLTPAGRHLMAEANALLGQARSFQQLAADLGLSLSGTLDIGCFYTVAPLIVPELIRAFTAANPAARINCQEGHHEELLTGLHEGRFEMALSYDLEAGHGVAFEPLAEFPPYAILAPSHPLAEHPRVSLAQLAAEPMILLDWPFSRDYFRSLFLSVGLEPVVGHRTNSFDMVRGLVANGFGYSLLNAPPHNDRAPDGKPYRTAQLKEKLRPLRLGLLRLEGLRPTRLARAFADHCRSAAGEKHFPFHAAGGGGGPMAKDR